MKIRKVETHLIKTEKSTLVGENFPCWKAGNRSAECKTLNELATYYLATKIPSAAIQSLLKKQNHERINKFEIEPEAGWTRLGLAYEQKSEFENAVAAIKEGLNKAKDANSGICLRIIFKHLGSCYTSMKEYQ